MAEESVETEEINYEEQYGVLSEEIKKLKIDISSLQLSNRSLVNQNRDEKKKVMDCRLQIADLEGRLKAFDATKQELSDSQLQCERIRMSLETSEAKLTDAERRTDEANGLIKIKDSIITKQSNFTKEIEERLRNTTEECDRFSVKINNLETELNIALIRGEDADDLRERLNGLQTLFDNLVQDRSETVSEGGLTAANNYFKVEEERLGKKIEGLKQVKSELESKIQSQEEEKKQMQLEMENQLNEYEELREKCATLEARIKEMNSSERRYGGIMGNRLIGPTLPPWIADEKKLEKDLERLSKTDPATLRAKVMELESQVNELNQLLTYREDVILRIHEEISKKSQKIEASDVERSSLNAQISILKRELATAREDLSRRGAGPIELEAEIERLRNKRDREYQRRKRVEADVETVEKENHDLKQRIRRLEEVAVSIPKSIPQNDPSDRNRIADLQSTVNQLRMDNEAKRSELFDLRARFDAKSNQVEKMSGDFKANERACAELTTQLTSTRTQLEVTVKDLESVRCRALRGGAEVERWHADLVSLQTTNKFLSSQLNELRGKIIFKDRWAADLTKRCEELVVKHKVEVKEVPLTNGISDAVFCPKCDGFLSNKENFSEENMIFMLESKLRASEERCKHLLDDSARIRKQMEERDTESESQITELQQSLLICSQHAEQAQNDTLKAYGRTDKMTTEIVQLEKCLSETRVQLAEARAEHRKCDQENQAAAALTSPPAKRTRRGTVNNGKVNSKTNQDCPNCVELRKQMQEADFLLNENTRLEASLTEKIGGLREEIALNDKTILELRCELTEVYKRQLNKV